MNFAEKLNKNMMKQTNKHLLQFPPELLYNQQQTIFNFKLGIFQLFVYFIIVYTISAIFNTRRKGKKH